MALHRIAAVSEIPEGSSRAFTIGARSVLLCHSSAGMFAVENMCSHAYALLEGGKIKGPYIFCPLHGVRFDLRNGTPNGNLTKKPLAVYSLGIVGEEVIVDLPDD